MITSEQLRILQHSLGVDGHGQGEMYRNHYVVGPGSDGFGDCRRLTEAGLMQDHGPQALAGSMHCFTVTDAGAEHVRQHSPPPPRLTRSQKRYRYWRRVGDAIGMTYGQFIKSTLSKESRVYD